MRSVRSGYARSVLGAALTAYVVLFAWWLHDGFLHRDLWLAVATVPLFFVAVVALAFSRISARHTVLLVLAVGALLQLLALTRLPLTSDDSQRYVWDATVQVSGTDPYRYPPSAPQLAHLRTAPLFGPAGPCAYDFPGGCTAINRPTVHTIYPPVAEAAFVVFSFGGNGGQLPLQVFAALGSLLIAWLLGRCALARGSPAWPVALWAWCPVVVSELGNNAHIDWLAVLLTVLGVWAFGARRPALAGVLVGLAIATKLYPALVLAALLRRRPLVVLGSAVGVVVLSYLPHVAAVGTDVLGYLPGYLHEEGYESGTRFLLLGAVLPHPVDTVVGVLIVVAAAAWAWRRGDPAHPSRAAVVVVGAALLVATPNDPWYAPMLIALAVLSGAWEWLPVAIAPTFTYLYHVAYASGPLGADTIWAIALAATVLAYLVRRRRVAAADSTIFMPSTRHEPPRA